MKRKQNEGHSWQHLSCSTGKCKVRGRLQRVLEVLLIPWGFLISMLGAGPLRDTVTSLRLGSKGSCQVFVTPLK